VIKALLLTNNQIIISQSIPQSDDDSELYYNLMYPYVFTLDSSSKTGFKLTPWLNEVTDITENFILYPDTIITMKDPKPEIVSHYKKLVLFDEDAIVEQVEEVAPEVLRPIEVNSVEYRDLKPTESKEETLLDDDEIYEEEEV
jgi:hypothetical protein